MSLLPPHDYPTIKRNLALGHGTQGDCDSSPLPLMTSRGLISAIDSYVSTLKVSLFNLPTQSKASEQLEKRNRRDGQRMIFMPSSAGIIM